MADYRNAIPYIQKAEGGLSRAITDTASKNPSPYVHNGQSGWHTNRGITWETFKSLAPKAGYAVTEDNFIRMPDNIWLSIYKIGYWDPMKGDSYQSQAVANAVVDFAWASGTGGATRALSKYLGKQGILATNAQSIADGFNKLVKDKSEAAAFNSLIDERKRFFQSLNQPANEKGWLARMETLRQQGTSILGAGVEFIKKNPIKSGVAIALGLSLIITGVVVMRKTA